MSNHSKPSILTQENEAFALMGRLHVVLRREVGRVIDIKYMAVNPEYCRHVLEFARDLGKPDINAIIQKVAGLYFDEHGLFEFTKGNLKTNKRFTISLAPIVKAPKANAKELLVDAATPAALTENEDVSNTYVGRLR